MSAPDSLAIRPATGGDAAPLLALSRRADQLFAAHGFPQIPALPPTPLVEFRAFLTENSSFIALLGTLPAGFAVCGAAGEHFWLKELAVDPVHGRKGIGSALVDAAVGQAKLARHSAIFLSTFRNVPFNRPFYARRGFVAIDAETAAEELREQFLREIPVGIDPAARVLMVRDLTIS